MKKQLIFFSFLFTVSLSYFLNSCDKVENPVIPPLEIDTTLYPGNWVDYPWPVFVQNTNTLKNVLIEDYTGHRCPNCPAATAIAEGIKTANPGRVFIAAIHAAPGDPFQFVSVSGDGEYPHYATDFTTDAGDAYVTDISGIIGNPVGMINREISPEGTPWNHVTSSWSGVVAGILSANDLKINIQQELNYYSSTRGLFVHIEAEALTSISANISLVSYLIEKEFEASQKDGAITIDDYIHKDVFRAPISQFYGESIFSSATTNEKFTVDFSIGIDAAFLDSNMMVITYAMDLDTYQIYQVIETDVFP